MSGMMKVLRKFAGLEPDFWDFQVIDIVDGTHYVFYSGINPEGERVEISIDGINRKGRGIWFKDLDPDPYRGKHEEILLFMDSSFNWHKYIAPGEGERFATVGKLSFKLVPEMGIKESRLPIIEKLRKKKGVQYVLVAELFPWIPDQEEIRNWLSYVQAKGLIDRLPEIETTMQKLQFRVKDLESKNLLLQEEVRRLASERDVLLREVMRLRSEYAFVRISGEVMQLMEKLQVKQIEEKREEIEKPSFLERLRRKEDLQAKLEEIDKRLKEIEEERQKAREEAGE
ncbi:MAG: hypothetical protein ACP5KE_09330 [Candidatus Methanodesulfokora sp.]|jgi:FtsZ-binding cell division protein ZapB